VIYKLSPKDYSGFKDLMRQHSDIASLEWIRHIDEDRERVEIYVNKRPFKGYMMIHRRVNVLIKADSEAVLRSFLGLLNQDREYAFRCSDWMSDLVMKVFKPHKKGYNGVILLTYFTDKNMFKEYIDPNYVVKPLSKDSAREILAHTRRPLTLEFIRNRITKGYFYGIYDNQELISHIGTLWETNEACEIGFAYTKEKYRGRGLAKILASIVTDRILKEGKIPILHTVETNTSAIKVYEALGYQRVAREWAYFYTPKLRA
jgi:ribosomal protein S18 acetylase RimI-like enzyme